MRTATFRQRALSGARMAGTFLKTPAYQLVEVLAGSGLDFLCLDAEHAPFDRSALDACTGIGRALDFPILIRTADASPREILQALDYGAAGVVVPHVDSVDKAQEVARAARFGLNGRGYAGSSRWAGYATRPMPELLERSQSETLVLAQIEEPAGVEAAQGIAAVAGMDGLFLGPADLSVGYGHDHQTAPELFEAMRRTGAAARAAGKAYGTFVPDAAKARDWARDYGFGLFFVASEQSWMRAGAAEVARGLHDD